jgi:LysR family nitrogen assimilation transcriptional regulator
MRTHGEYLDLAALAAFVELAEQCVVRTRPAEALTSADQARIARLEANLGVRLFEPGDAAQLRLSSAGQRLLQTGVELLAARDATLRSVADVSRNPAELAAFAAPPTVAAILATPVVVRFRNELSSARLRFIEGMSGHIREWLAIGRIDAGILLDCYGVPGERLWSEPLFLVADADLLPAHLEELRFADLASYPMLLPSHAHGLRQIIERAAERQGLKLDIRLEGDSLNTLMDWVIERLGVAILPLGAVQTHHRRSDSVRCVRIVCPTIERHLVLCTASNKHPSATVRALLKIISEEAARLKPAISY